jgi:predicted AlkP superfamily phosphohydrolase/phosphomutase
VWLRDQIFPGPRQEELPDLIVTWNDEAPFLALTSPRLGLVEGVNPDPRSGTHSSYGFMLAEGPGIPTAYEGRGHLKAVASTVLGVLGLRQMDRDGNPLPALIPHPAYHKASPVDVTK